ncbi:MAG: hypothetical protein E7262_01500 [Lachnospiraceae bacterium]|nr:hypothetical protein [Lachnospiraceae bacterium]
MKNFLKNRAQSFKDRIASKVVMLVIFLLFHLGVISWETSMILCVIDILLVDELVLALKEAFTNAIMKSIEEMEAENK